VAQEPKGQAVGGSKGGLKVPPDHFEANSLEAVIEVGGGSNFYPEPDLKALAIVESIVRPT